MKKNKLVTLLSCVMMFVVILAFSGCGQETIESKIDDNESVKNKIQETAKKSGYDVELDGNMLVYKSDLKKTYKDAEKIVKDEKLKKGLGDALDKSAPVYNALAKSIADESKLGEVSIKIIYTYEGEPVVEKIYSSKNVKADDSKKDDQTKSKDNTKTEEKQDKAKTEEKQDTKKTE